MATNPADPPPPSDGDLLREWATGSDFAFCVLVERYQGELAGVVARQMRGNPRLLAHTDDVVQTVFIKLVRHRGRLIASGRPLRPWLMQVATRSAIDCYRKLVHQPIANSEGLSAVAAPSAPQVTDQQIALERCLDELPVRLAVPLHFERWEEMTRTEIAGVMGVSNSTVTTRLQQAEKWLLLCVQRRLLIHPEGRA